MKRLILTLAAVLNAATSVNAADAHIQPAPDPLPMEGGWRFQVTPYAWQPTIGGDIRPGRGLPTFSTRLSMDSVLDDLNGAFFINGTGRYNRWLFYGDLTWASITERDKLIVPGFGIPAEIQGKVAQTSLTLAVGYSIIETPSFVLDVVAGARAWRMASRVEAEATVAANFSLGAAGRAARSWVDPIVGARVRWQFDPDWSVIGYGDVGGFNEGSNLTWQLVGTLNYRVSDLIYLSAGWRHLHAGYEERGELLKVDMSGPLVGATLRF